MQRGDDQLRSRRFMAQHASQAAEFISWAGRKRRVAADRAHWPPGAAGEAPDGVHSSRTSAFQFGAITRKAPPPSGGLWCGLYSGQKAQQPAFMLKIDDTSLFNAGAVMGHGAPSLWHWFQAMYHLWGKCQCRHPALYYNYPLFTRLMHLLGA